MWLRTGVNAGFSDSFYENPEMVQAYVEKGDRRKKWIQNLLEYSWKGDRGECIERPIVAIQLLAAT